MPGDLLSIPRLVVAAPQGRSGKTTVSLGLCAAFAARGLTVQPFKKGPDYIDPSWLTEAAGRPCRNLDPFFMPAPGALVAAFVKPYVRLSRDVPGRGEAGGRGHEDPNPGEGTREEAHDEPSRAMRAAPATVFEPSCSEEPPSSQPAYLAVIEGNHGLYDSLDDDGSGSTAAVARALHAPVLLVVNTARMGRSAAALVQGYQAFEPDTPIRGVLLNHVARGRHEDKLRRAIEFHCGIPVVGALPRDDALLIPDRHLGLVPRGERGGPVPALEACRAAVERYCNLDRILEVAKAAPPLPAAPLVVAANRAAGLAAWRRRIAVFRDRAFSFYYCENLETLEDEGGRLLFVDAFTADALPDCDLLYIGGGFPEMFMAELAANTSLLASVRYAAEQGLPVYAECGGLMYLSRRLIWGDRVATMAGVLPVDIEMTARSQGHGYVQAVVDAPNPFFPRGSVLRGHEFHNSRLAAPAELATAYRLERGQGFGGRDGLVYRNILASYTHLHAHGAPGWGAGLLRTSSH